VATVDARNGGPLQTSIKNDKKKVLIGNPAAGRGLCAGYRRR
jgi:hypothetical protein